MLSKIHRVQEDNILFHCKTTYLFNYKTFDLEEQLENVSLSLFSCLSRKRSINVKIFKRNMFLKSSWREHTTIRNRVKEGEVSVSVILSGLSVLDVQ